MDASHALIKARALCARQERSRSELRARLLAWELDEPEIGRLLGQLEKEGFLNERRFAEHYAISKLRQKGWGRLKIRHALKEKHVEEQAMNDGLAAINEDEYLALVRALVKKYWLREKGHEEFERAQRVVRYMISRGFEADLVKVALRG